MSSQKAEVLHSGHGTVSYNLEPGVKVMECKYRCGDYFIVSSRTKNAPHHLACGIEAAVQCQQQLHNHQGPYYDAWLRGMAMWIARMRLQ